MGERGVGEGEGWRLPSKVSRMICVRTFLGKDWISVFTGMTLHDVRGPMSDTEDPTLELEEVLNRNKKLIDTQSEKC